VISQITKIKDFGVFHNFNWPSGLDDFKRYNVLYGWNYSGKTTVSRLFRCFELGRLHKDFDKATFAIKDVLGSIYDHTHLSDYPVDIRVFNEDFVEDNVKWEEGIEPIFMLGEKNIELEKQLEEKKNIITQKMKERYEHRNRRYRKDADLNKSLTEKARNITNVLSLGRNFNKTNLEQEIQKIDEANKIVLSNESVKDNLAKFNSTDKKDPIPTLEFEKKRTSEEKYGSSADVIIEGDSLADNIETARELLSREINAKVIQRLKDNPKLNEWVKTGKEFHEGKRICEFCGNELPKNLLDELNAHFSDEYEVLLSEIDNLKMTLDQKKIKIDTPDEAKFYQEFENDYKKFHKVFVSESDKYNTIIEKIKRQLEEKKRNVFQVFTIDELTDNHSQIECCVAEINAVIKKHKQRTDKFEQEKSRAKNRLLKHYTAEFIKDYEYHKVSKEIRELEEKERSLSLVIRGLEDEIRKIENQLSDAAKGAETINKYIESYFGKDDIKVQAEKEGKFKLKRFEQDATNLSQGEKTAISFAYFISKLHDKSTDISKTIIIIDDPVSSLDTNHLYHTYSMIKNTFENCAQLFIATHNFELFNLLKDWLKDKPKKSPHSYYLVKRESSKNHFESSIYNLPDELRKFKSEYHYLFSLIYNFHKNPSSDHNALYNVPNLVRRLLEAFMGFKVPIYAGLNKKLPLLIADDTKREKVWKFINQYSHNASLPRSLQFPDLSECEEVVRTVIDSMKNMDPEHYDCLIDEIEGKSEIADERLRKRRKVDEKPREKVESSITVFYESIKIKTIGRAAARNESSVIEFSENFDESSLKPFACAYVTSYTFDPIARYGQYILLAQQDEVAVDGDLVAVESLDGERYLRRMAVDGDILILSSINPNKVISPIQINIDKVLVYKVMGVIYESTLPSRGGETIHDGEWQPYEKFDISFFDDLKMVSVEGDSLEPIALEGQRVLVGVPKNPDQYSIENGGLAAIETKDDIGHVIKRVFRKENEWTLVSPNPLASYPPDIVSVEKIEKVWPLYGVIFETETGDG